MAYLIFTANGQEIDRKELTGPAVIGRAPDADFHIRDILLSRNHCKIEKIEPAGKKGAEEWVVTDLGSKNGTYIGQTQITRHTLNDGDELRVGRTKVTFRAGAMDPNHPGKRRTGAVVRPVDPAEALEGTLSGFVLVEPDQVEHAPGAPVPQPRPPEPSSYNTDDVYGMLSEIASSSWDSIQEQASRPIVRERPLPRPTAYTNAPRAPHRPRVAFSLQAHPEPAEQPAPLRQRRWRLPQVGRLPRMPRLPRMRRPAMLAGVAVLATAVLVSGWLAVVLGRAQFEASTLTDTTPPRVRSEVMVEAPEPSAEDAIAPPAPTDPPAPLENAAVNLSEPAGAAMAPEGESEALPPYNLPPQPILMRGLREVALHRLLLR